MDTRKPPRKRTHSGTETAVLAKSARRCALCFHLSGDISEKLGQIAHLDGDRTNNSEDNLAWMCLPHHSLFDSKTSQHKNYTMHEIKNARARLYALVAGGNHMSTVTARPNLQAKADKRTLRDLLVIVPSSGTIAFLRTRNFAGFSFDWKSIRDIERFVGGRSGPDHEFLDPELEMARKKFRDECLSLLSALAIHTFPTNNADRQTVPPDWEIEAPESFSRAIGEIHAAADSVCNSYDELVRMARRKLAG